MSVAIGNQPVGAGSAPFHGAIDEVAIFDRGLAPSEISVLYLGIDPVAPVPALDGAVRWLLVALVSLLGMAVARRFGPRR